MAQVTYSRHELGDLEGLESFLMSEDPLAASETFSLIAEAIELLERHPLIGRPVDELRELVISRGRSGYVALYSFEPDHDAVLILAIRHQREGGFAGIWL